MNKSNLFCLIYKWGRIALIVAMIATVLFVFYNSSLSKEESSEQSGIVGEIVEEILPDNTPIEDFFLENLRKIAHFTEYGLLGIEIAIYILLYERKRWRLFTPLSIFVPFVVGFLDETIQVLSDRGPMITDVWIDIGGFCTFTLLSYLIGGLVLLTIKFIQSKKTSPSEQEN